MDWLPAPKLPRLTGWSVKKVCADAKLLKVSCTSVVEPLVTLKSSEVKPPP